VKKKDISPKIVADFEANSTQVENLLEFKEIVVKKVIDDGTWYEAGWEEQPDAENKATDLLLHLRSEQQREIRVYLSGVTMPDGSGIELVI
jgi:hypothetical protein